MGRQIEEVKATDVTAGARREKELDGLSFCRDQQMEFEAVEVASLAGDVAPIGLTLIDPGPREKSVIISSSMDSSGFGC